MNYNDVLTLRAEAGAHGDWQMVEVCNRALEGDAEALAECERVVEEAQA